jgi:hypothetical protein
MEKTETYIIPKSVKNVEVSVMVIVFITFIIIPGTLHLFGKIGSLDLLMSVTFFILLVLLCISIENPFEYFKTMQNVIRIDKNGIELLSGGIILVHMKWGQVSDIKEDYFHERMKIIGPGHVVIPIDYRLKHFQDLKDKLFERSPRLIRLYEGKRVFSAKKDPLIKKEFYIYWILIIFFILCVASRVEDDHVAQWVGSMSSIPILLFFRMPYWFPKNVEIKKDMLAMNHSWRKIDIPFDQIESIELKKLQTKRYFSIDVARICYGNKSIKISYLECGGVLFFAALKNALARYKSPKLKRWVENGPNMMRSV